MGEHLPCKQGVMGSNPIISSREAPTGEKKSEQINSRKPEKAILVKITRGLRLKANDKGFWKETEKNL